MVESSLPRKQRLARYNAPLHVRQKQVAAHLAKDLRATQKKRSMPVRKGDTVKILRGRFFGRSGKVIRVNLSARTVSIEGVNVKKQTGKEIPAPIDPSNVLITQLSERKKQ
ncbi:50S ribosomal protein L24 [Candidatus Micrarchaeota archaeon]|nr:50S ribosomal protein L24 [Candidatus Micrarchaeota archaeon]